VNERKGEARFVTGNFDGCQAVFSYDPSGFMLTTFQHFPGGKPALTRK